MLPSHPPKSNVHVDTALLANVATQLRLLGELLEEMCLADVSCISERSLSNSVRLAGSRKNECVSTRFHNALSQDLSSLDKITINTAQFEGAPTPTNASNPHGPGLNFKAPPQYSQHETPARVGSIQAAQSVHELVACPIFMDGNPKIRAVLPALPDLPPINDDLRPALTTNMPEHGSGDKNEVSRREMRSWSFSKDILACRHKTLFDGVGEFSKHAKLVIFLGGYTTFSSSIYTGLVASSFGICFLACAIVPAFMPMHPFRNDRIGFLTIYIHVIGFHTWIFWRNHGKHVYLRDLWTWMVDKDTECQARKRKLMTGIAAWFILVLMVLLASICVLGACGPSMNIWLSTEETLTTRVLALAHAVLMFIAIPTHVPAIVIGLISFVFMCFLHHSDFTSITRRVRAKLPSQVAEGELLMLKEPKPTVDAARLVLELVCAEAEKAQYRLEWTCSKCKLLWCHQIVYAFLQVIVVVDHVGPILVAETREEYLGYWREHSDVSISLLVFHGLCGSCVILAALLAPAGTTSSFKHQCRELVDFIRSNGGAIDDCALAGCFLEKQIEGFTVGELILTSSLASKFYSVVVVCSVLWTIGFA
eukprot:TRINITY_DN2327_c0_g1_i10.p1 TRINITY_DN2327_c0_g1~~TRINITY_DN2327_c0_g1_i10.p1  ORF type:complete len:607 (-),score=51.63 TRINITY_DN2327_c0_g1_i10:32-1810(-)